ncbi:NAD(P)/FAD-dependent oxidoreductase [Gandjariella thermophila]|uniref:Pyridine nucleotide-disulfide oxidoreductase n=1 Tax=Gandjariella thermophila TaxID=1931992 RepID=A0A4D4JB99_9PSEU|nr:FAD-dependent oxidoreductase [Gandjariella thermophila]GDY31113.1 pyridine nucleotide-disulfide oxidoreductase [Gandjariella thermophila]
MTTAPFVIVGGGLAGAKAAEALREQGFDGPLVLVGQESHLPYERPPLSKDFLAGKVTREEFTVHPETWYQEHDVELRLGAPATALHRDSHEVDLADGGRLGYGKLLLATGSRPRRLPVAGADAEGVHYLRDLEHAAALRAALDTAQRLVVIGGGWIGLEVAAVARERGVEVTVIEAAHLPLLGALGPELATVFAHLHRDHGVDLRLDTHLAEITTTGGVATGVRLADGTTLPADAVLVGIGAAPNVGLADRAGLAVSDGVLTDASLRTSDPDICAVGDIANAKHPVLGIRVRVEHWATALHQPATAATTMLGGPASYQELPYFFTDQYDLGMEYLGHAPAGHYDRVVVRGDTASREFIAFWLDARDRVLAGMNVNVWDVTDAVKALILAGRPVDTKRLADPDTPLEDVPTQAR